MRAEAPSAAWGLAKALSYRLLSFVGTVLGAVVFVQCLLAYAPGDAIDNLPNDEDVRPMLEEEWHLDEPVPLQVLRAIADLARGDFRSSVVLYPGAPVRDLVLAPALRSVGLALGATAVALAYSVAVAFSSRARTALAGPLGFLSVAPVFLLAYVSIELINSVTWQLIEAHVIARPAWFALPAEPSWLRAFLALVFLAVGSGTLIEAEDEIGNAVRRIRASGYVEAARARGAPTWPHILRNLVPPLATVASKRAAVLLGGLVIVETVTLQNGIGTLLWRAAEARDYPVALGATVLLAATVAAIRLAADTVRIVADPRLRTAS